MPLMYMAISAIIVTMIAPAMMRSAPNLLVLFIVPPRDSADMSRIRVTWDSIRAHADISIRYDHARRQVRKHGSRPAFTPDGSCRDALFISLAGVVVPQVDELRSDIPASGQAHFDGLARLTARHVYRGLGHIDLMRLRTRRTSESNPHSTFLPERNRLPYLVTRLCLKSRILSRSRGF